MQQHILLQGFKQTNGVVFPLHTFGQPLELSYILIKFYYSCKSILLTLRDLVESHVGHKGASNGNAVLEQSGILTRTEELLIANSRPKELWHYNDSNTILFCNYHCL